MASIFGQPSRWAATGALLLPERLELPSEDPPAAVHWMDESIEGCHHWVRQVRLPAGERLERLDSGFWPDCDGGSSPSECATVYAGQGHRLSSWEVALWLVRGQISHNLSQVLGDVMDLGQCLTAPVQVVVGGVDIGLHGERRRLLGGSMRIL